MAKFRGLPVFIGRFEGFETIPTKRGEMTLAQFLTNGRGNGLGDNFNASLPEDWPRTGMSEGKMLALPYSTSMANGRLYYNVMPPTVQRVMDFQRLAEFAEQLVEEASTGQRTFETA